MFYLKIMRLMDIIRQAVAEATAKQNDGFVSKGLKEELVEIRDYLNKVLED